MNWKPFRSCRFCGAGYGNTGNWELGPGPDGQEMNENLKIQKDMVSFLYQHYGEKITLDEIRGLRTCQPEQMLQALQTLSAAVARRFSECLPLKGKPASSGHHRPEHHRYCSGLRLSPSELFFQIFLQSLWIYSPGIPEPESSGIYRKRPASLLKKHYFNISLKSSRSFGTSTGLAT